MALHKDAKGAAQALRIPIATAFPAPIPRRLARRDADDITSGTLTVTVAPDPTCGFNGDGDPIWVCPQQRPCTWETGKINRFWCGWSRLVTTCYDSTAYFDSSICDRDCRANTRNAGCQVASMPNCIVQELGNGIFSFGCNSGAGSFSFDSTQYNKPRDFKTAIFVNGAQKTEWASNLETITTEDSTGTTDSAIEETSSASSSATSSPKNDRNIGAIVGGVVGGLAVIGLIILGIVGFVFLRRRKNKAAHQHELNTGFAPQPDTPGLLDKTQWSPTHVGPYTDHPAPGYAPVPSSALHEAPNSGIVWSAELDGRRTDHHRGTMHEIG